MELIRTPEDSFAVFEEMGMQKQICIPKTIYRYVALPKMGFVEVWGDIGRFYYVIANYHTLNELIQPYQMNEPYVEFGLNENPEEFYFSEKMGAPKKTQPDSVTFSVVRPTRASGCIYCCRDVHCVVRSFVLRHQTCVERLFPTIYRIFGRKADPYTVLQMAGNTCLISCGEILAELKRCTYEGDALQMYLDGKELELLAVLTHAIETLDEQAVPHYTSYERQSVFDVQKLLQESVQKPPSIRKIARDFGINPNKLQELFKYYNGVTVMEYLRSYRMQQALSLLANDMILSDIAKEIGYQSTSRFSEAFVKTYGISPGKYRKLYIQ